VAAAIAYNPYFVRIIRTITEMRAACREMKRSGKRLGFVPTMGALHAGHLSLVRAAKAQCHAVAVSIFVNPTQFGPQEDLSRYPRPFEKDVALLEAEKADLLFAPSAEEMYPPGAVSWVYVEGMSEMLEGASRPGHFRGVTTVVSKLFNAVEPDAAFFGQKDAQQAAVIKKMARDLDLPVAIEICPIVREADGLALSSRNVYLSLEERQQALVLHRSLQHVQALFAQGERDATRLVDAAKTVFAAVPQVRLDYFAIVDPATFEPVARAGTGSLAVTSAWVGKTRLLDNLIF
jgi:pantoate--beta-alanine ligase